MSILCTLFGHKSVRGYCGSEPHFEVEAHAVDGIGRHHLYMRTRCERCFKTYRIGNVHVPRDANTEEALKKYFELINNPPKGHMSLNETIKKNFEEEIEEVLSKKKDKVKFVGVSPCMISDYIESKEGWKISEMETNGWQYDWWYNITHGDDKFTAQGSGYYGNSSVSIDTD